MKEVFFSQADWQLFTNIQTLPQQAGVSRHQLPKLITKELLDNALDTGTEVSIQHHSEDSFTDIVIIRDQGRGIPGDNDEIAHLFSLKRPLTSSKRLRLPSRGALGNGLRVVVATLYCLNGHLEVATRGRRLKIIPQDDGFSRWEDLGKYEDQGSEILFRIPDNFFGHDILTWANIALKVNQGDSYQGLSSALWYDSDSFYSLMLTCPPDLSLRKFLQLFDKISLNKARKVEKKLQELHPEAHSIPLREFPREGAEVLFAELRENSRVISPQKMGGIRQMEDFPIYLSHKSLLKLPPSKGLYAAEIPLHIEAFAHINEEGHHQVLVNKTPIIGEVDLQIYDKKCLLYGCGLNKTFDIPKIPSSARFWINIMIPYMPIVSNGKEPDLSVLEEELQALLQKAARKLRKSQSKEALPPTLRTKLPSQKKVLLENLEAGIQKASGSGQYRYSLRQLYYSLRPFVMQATGKELKYANFNTIITDYEFEQGQDLPGVYRDERGTLLHPHSHREVRLGTRSVEEYARPLYNFNKILYSEKEGFFEILKEAGFCERHDCALLTSKGFASRAARDVIDLLAKTEEELIFFCIHDADLSGTLIYQALQGATRARAERKVKIINLGLEPWEGLEMGLEVEKLERRSTKNPAQYVLAKEKDLEQKKPFHYEGYERWAEWSEWLKSFRIELNAMDTPTFIQWLHQKIEPYQNGKVIPKEAYLQEEAEKNLELFMKSQIRAQLLEELDLDQQIEQRLRQLSPEMKTLLQNQEWQARLQNILAQEPRNSWLQSFEHELGKLAQKLRGKR